MDVSKQVIDRFLTGKLTGSELEAFQKRLSEDATFKSMVDQRRVALGNQSTTSPTKEKNAIIKWLIPIGLLAIALMLYLFILKPTARNTNSQANQHLIEKYYQAYEPTFTEEEVASVEEVEKLMALMKAKKYEQAIPALEEKLSMTKNAKLNLALGTCYLESGKYNKALKEFKTAKENVSSQDIAYWYSALTYIKDGKLKKAQKELSPLIANSQSEYHEKAKALLATLEK